MYGPWEAALGGVLDFAQLQNLHVLCLQETRVNNHSWNAVTRAVKARGWQLFPGPQGRNSKNVVEGGTLVLTKWPAEPWPFLSTWCLWKDPWPSNSIDLSKGR